MNMLASRLRMNGWIHTPIVRTPACIEQKHISCGRHGILVQSTQSYVDVLFACTKPRAQMILTCRDQRGGGRSVMVVVLIVNGGFLPPVQAHVTCLGLDCLVVYNINPLVFRYHPFQTRILFDRLAGHELGRVDCAIGEVLNVVDTRYILFVDDRAREEALIESKPGK